MKYLTPGWDFSVAFKLLRKGNSVKLNGQHPCCHLFSNTIYRKYVI